MMERVELLLPLLMLILSSYNLRVESEDGLFVGKLQGGCIVEEREALFNFKQNLSGPQLLLSNWDIGEDCCVWKGVGCSSTTGHVIKLDLYWFIDEYNYADIYFNATSLISSLFRLQHLQYLCLRGIYFTHTSILQSIFSGSLANLRYLDLSYSQSDGLISPQFKNLTNLQHLDIHHSWFISVIPSHIENLINLRYLDLSYSGLSGVIPPHFGNLTNLQHLDLSWNYVPGLNYNTGRYSLVVSNLLWMSRLSSLQYLDMSHLNLTLATNWLQEIKMLPNLSVLDLSVSNLQTLPNLLPYFNFSSTIEVFDLSENQLSNFKIPSCLSNMTNLVELDLHDCQIYGEVPSNLLGAPCRLRKLDLSQNFIDGTISSMVLSQLSGCITRDELKYLDLSNNHFSGILPNWLDQFRSLNTLNLQSNKLTGPISWASLSLLCDIDILNLSENNFIQLIDDGSASRCKEYKMTVMDISNNQLSGSIPESIGQMRHLTYLDLRNNRLSGTIPQSLGQLMNLTYLNLNSNMLQDSLSNVYFANLSQLQTLDLSRNHLDFNKIMFSWVPPFQLTQLYLSSCPIGPHFLIWLQTQKSLRFLDISNGGISDIIPSWFWNISSHTYYLNLSHNAIRGELPMLLNIQTSIIDMRSNLLEGNLPRLVGFQYISFSDNMFSKGIEWNINANMSWEFLDLSENHLFEKIPNSICQMILIGFLDLSYNNLWGEIPKCQWNFGNFEHTQLKFIGLANNNLWGSIPQWIGNQPSLLSLYMNNNNFQGDLSFLRNCSMLITLDLGQNKLTGIIPSWIQDTLSSLKILILRSNKFYGSIPSNLFKMEGLQIVDLANNFLSGKLPKSVKFLKAMTIQNKSLESLIPNDIFLMHNTLPKTSFPDSLELIIKGVERKFTNILSLMMSMDLSGNNFSGEVPIDLMSLVGLISLNLSRNQFTGQIPKNIGIMKSLENLDLSWNHFSGEIPESIANLSGLSYLNLSYNQLSGKIPTGTQLETFDKSSYYGNLNLCGKPLLKTCEGNEHGIHNGGINSHDDDDDNFGLFLGMGIGFVVGLWSVLGMLLLKRSWAIAYFQLFDNVIDNVYLFVILKLNRWFN